MSPPPPPRSNLTDAEAQTVQDFIETSTRDALDQWRPAKALYRSIHEIEGNLEEHLAKWKSLICHNYYYAERFFIANILANGDLFKPDTPPEEVVREAHEPRGVVIDNTLYIAITHSDYLPNEERDGTDVMTLATIPVASIRNYDAEKQRGRE
jgi:hypothetical protein